MPTMRAVTLLAFPSIFALGCSRVNSTPTSAMPSSQNPAPAAAPPDSIAAERARYANEAMALVKGREAAPAESVFKNLKVLFGFPAGRLIPVMNDGWGKALGVNCTHCHVPGDWASDAKTPKMIARDMVRMGNVISQQLRGIPGLQDRRPIVNCTTCHRGQLKPAT